MKLFSILLLTSILAAAPAHADVIRLRASVRLPRDAQLVHLVDVAELDGAHAVALGETVVARVTDPGTVLRVSIDDVRTALDAAGAHWGHVNLSGREVLVRPRGGRTGAVGAMSGAVLPGTKPGTRRGKSVPIQILAADAIGETTLRGAVAREMVRRLGVAADTLRLSFDAKDLALLAVTGADVRFELTPESSAASDRATMTVRIWRNGQVESQTQLSMRPQLRRHIVALRRDIDRGAIVTDEDLEPRLAWLAPTQSALVCDPSTAAHRVATRRLQAGEHLRERDVHRRTIVERGDRVTVRCLVGGVAISLQAEARADGAEGETIEFRKLGERDTFRATVTRSGEAVLDLSAH